jgi:aldehyde dehydrogenase (NAD+)
MTTPIRKRLFDSHHQAAGMGHYYGKYGFDMLTHAKSLLISPPDVAIDHLLPPYSPEKNAALKLWFEY